MKTEGVTFAFAVAGLLVFQTLYAWSQPLPWPAMVGIAGFDVSLVAAFFWASYRERLVTTRRFDRVQQSLTGILDLAGKQQRHWLAIVDSVSLEPEDRAALQSLQRLLSTRSQIENKASADRADYQIEAIVDVIQTMLLLNHSLMTDFDDVLSFYRVTYERLRSVREKNKLHRFRLGTSVDFLGQMGTETNQYSERLVLDVLASFEEITRFSQGIGTEVRGKIHHLMDPANPEGLHSVNTQSAAIQSALDLFFGELGRMQTNVETSIRENLVQMQRIQSIAEGIAEFSESIRMISLNLNIEAARGHQGSNNGKAVQVLATKLSEFAVKATEMAAQQQDVIGTGSRILAHAGEAQRSQLSDLMAAVAPIKGRLDPFARIVGLTFSRFEEVETTMDRLSTAIESRLQAVIGKFQFQDLVRQEQEHILALFAHVRLRAEEGEGHLGALDETAKLGAWNDLLDTFERIASTENERNVLRAYREMHPAVAKGDAGPEISAGTVELF